MSNEEPNAPAALIARIRGLSRPLEPKPTALKPRLKRLEGIRAVLFDVYGTLVISASGDIAAGEESENTEAFHAALDKAGLATQAPEAYADGPGRMVESIRAAHERSRAQGIEYPEVDILAIWQDVLKDLPLAAAVDERALRIAAIEYECRENPVWPMPAAAETVKGLRNRGFLLGIVSNAQFYTPLMLEALLGASPQELGFLPEICAWSYQHGVAKPSTQLYERVLKRLADRHGVQPEQVLYVGNDQLKDVWPAARLACRTALFAGDQRSLRLREHDERCRHVEPDLVITNLAQLANL